MKKEILFITGTRAEYGLLRPVIRRMQKSPTLTPRVLVTGMHTLSKFGRTMKNIEEDGTSIDAVVTISERDDMLSSLAKEITGIGDYCKAHKPDLMVLLGDRDEMLAGAMVAIHLGIPVAHLRGGEKTGDVADEYIRSIITKCAHLHFTVTETYRNRVLRHGEDPKRVFVISPTEFDEIDEMPLVSKKELANMFHLDVNKPWAVVVHHPTPLAKENFQSQIRPLLMTLGQRKDIQKIVIYPNSDTGHDVFIKEIERYRDRQDFFITKSLPREQYLNFLKGSDCLVGNSSSGMAESAYFKIPVLTIGNRQQGRERGENVTDATYARASIEAGLRRLFSPEFRKKCLSMKSPFGVGGGSKAIVSTIERFLSKGNLFRKQVIYEGK